jgi:hypothetical protein
MGTKSGLSRKENIKYICILDDVDMKDQLLLSYLAEKRQMNNWCVKLFLRLLNISTVDWQNTGKRNEQLPY